MANIFDCKIYFDYKTPFVCEHPLSRILSIANHSFINIKTEPQILSRNINLSIVDSSLLSSLRDEVINSVHANLQTFSWGKGVSLFIDNY